MSELSPAKLNSNTIPIEEDDMSWHEPPSSPFISHVETDQENIAPPDVATATPVKQLIDVDEDEPQLTIKKASPSKGFGLKERRSPIKMSPAKRLSDDFEEPSFGQGIGEVKSPRKPSPAKKQAMERPESAMGGRSRNNSSPAKPSRTPSLERVDEPPQSAIKLRYSSSSDERMSPVKRPSSSHHNLGLRDNEGLTVAMKMMEETHTQRYESSSSYHTATDISDDEDLAGIEEIEYNPDGADVTMDDTCFSNFSEMPNLDMTKFAFLKQTPKKGLLIDEVDCSSSRSKSVC
jgi:hypothetical protein